MIVQPFAQRILNVSQSTGERSQYLYLPRPFGFDWIDDIFSGGCHPTDLNILLGKQNVGKTTMLLQIVRHQAKWAIENKYPLAPILFGFEHDEWSMFSRLMCMESWDITSETGEESLTYGTMNRGVLAVKREHPELAPDKFLQLLLERLPDVATKAYSEIMKYSSNMFIFYSDRRKTTVDQMKEAWRQIKDEHGLYGMPMIDYLQTMPAPESLWATKAYTNSDVIVSENLRALKDWAVREYIPVFAVSAVDDDAIREARPIHIEDADGPNAMKYSTDGGLVLNPDTKTASIRGKVTGKYVRVGVEKNRNHGPSGVEMRHASPGSAFLFEVEGEEVSLDESYQNLRFNTEKR